MTRPANPGRRPAPSYSRVAKRASAAGTVVALAWALGGGCTSLPDGKADEESDAVREGTERPDGARRPEGDDDGPVVVKKPDPCATKQGSSRTEKQQPRASASKVLFNNDFEKPNVPLVGDCGGWLDQAHGINTLYGTEDFQFAQFETVEGVLIRDENGIYTDPLGTGGRYAIGMLSTLQEDKLSLAFANDMPIVNVRLDVSGIAIQGCGTPVKVTKPRLQVSLYDGTIGKEALEKPLGEPLDSAIVTGSEVKDAWVFNWRTAVVPLDASGAKSGSVSIVFDLLEGGYTAIDNLSIVASTERGVVDADTNGIPDDEQCDEVEIDEPADVETDEPSDEEEPAEDEPAEDETTRETVDAGVTTRSSRDTETSTTSRSRRDAGR